MGKWHGKKLCALRLNVTLQSPHCYTVSFVYSSQCVVKRYATCCTDRLRDVAGVRKIPSFTLRLAACVRFYAA